MAIRVYAHEHTRIRVLEFAYFAYVLVRLFSSGTVHVSKRLLAFSAHSQTLSLSTSFDSLLHVHVLQRQQLIETLLKKSRIGGSALFGKVDINWFTVDISICLHLSE